MGVPYLARNHEDWFARLPFRLTMNVGPESHLEGNRHAAAYEQIGTGSLASIGIDGSVFLHSHVVAENAIVDIPISVDNISDKILAYVDAILTYFSIYNNNLTKNKIWLNFVVDGHPPAKKNRLEKTSLDAYSRMSIDAKRDLHERICDKLKAGADYRKLSFISNASLPANERGEGEMALYSLCRAIYKVRGDVKNVIVSNDTDIVAMMLLCNDPALVVISPAVSNVFITNHALIAKGLQLDSRQLIEYTLLHFIFFGSDYNLGLMAAPSKSKQKIIYEAVKNKNIDINHIGAQCGRRKPPVARTHTPFSSTYLSKLKQMLIVEALMAAKYYHSIGDEKIINLDSPNIYRLSSVARGQLPFINFGN